MSSSCLVAASTSVRSDSVAWASGESLARVMGAVAGGGEAGSTVVAGTAAVAEVSEEAEVPDEEVEVSVEEVDSLLALDVLSLAVTLMTLGLSMIRAILRRRVRPHRSTSRLYLFPFSTMPMIQVW